MSAAPKEITNADFIAHHYAQDHTDCPICAPLKCEMCNLEIDETADPDCEVLEFWNGANDADAFLCKECRSKYLEAQD